MSTRVLGRSSVTAIDYPQEDAQNRASGMSPTEAFGLVIEHAVVAALKKALPPADVAGPRLVSAKKAAVYLCLSEREIYNMIANRELSGVRHGRRLMLDIRDLERWIDTNKV